jgi:hypothetical protein
MNSFNYETLCALADKMRAEINSVAARMEEEIKATSEAHDPPGFISRHQARQNVERLLAVCTDLCAEFVADATEACGVEVGGNARVECDNLLVKVRARTDALLEKFTRSGDATIH